jgi:hypothetical protein
VAAGRVLFAHVEQTADDAEDARVAYVLDSRNRGEWRVRVHAREVEVDGVKIPFWIVIVREKEEEQK